MNTENSKKNRPHKSVPNSSQRLELRSSNKYDALQNSFIYFAWKKIRQQYKTNKLKILAPASNDQFQLPKGSYSVSDIPVYIEYIMKKNYPVILLFTFISTGLMID